MAHYSIFYDDGLTPGDWAPIFFCKRTIDDFTSSVFKLMRVQHSLNSQAKILDRKKFLNIAFSSLHFCHFLPAFIQTFEHFLQNLIKYNPTLEKQLHNKPISAKTDRLRVTPPSVVCIVFQTAIYKLRLNKSTPFKS